MKRRDGIGLGYGLGGKKCKVSTSKLTGVEDRKEPVTKKYRTRLRGLYDEANTYRNTWQDIADYTDPERGRYLWNTKDKESWDKGKKVHEKIVNGTSMEAVRTLAAGMQGGLTSPSRPWFALQTPDDELMEYQPVKEWLYAVRQTMLNVFAKSNFYNALHSMYEELALFGTSAMLMEDSLFNVSRFRNFTIGEFYIMLDADLVPNALYRHFSMTAHQLVEKFGVENVSNMVKRALEQNKPEYRYEVVHAIAPNDNKIIGKSNCEGMDYESIYFEVKGEPDTLLRRGGYREKPFAIARWQSHATDAYGVSPAKAALGDIKMLQKMEIKKLEALDKEIDPPMNATPDLKSKGGTMIPGGINYVDQPGGFAPSYNVKLNLADMAAEVQNVERRIQSAFYSDLFLAVLRTDKRMTATEVAERHEEKLLMLGPVLERLQSELLDPIVDRVFNMLQERQMVPPAPEELQDMDLKIDYIATLAQAQKLVGTESIEKVVGFASSMAELNPEILDKIDFDQSVDRYAAMVGAPPEIVRSDEDVEELRGARQQKQAEEEQQMKAAQMVESAKTMSETPMGDSTALDKFTSGDMSGGEGSTPFTEGV